MTEKSTSLPLEPTAYGARPISISTCCALAILLAVHALLAVTAIRRNSVTIDEVAHLPAGISYWQTGTFALYHHNPPLVKMLAAAAALTTHPEVDYNGSWKRAIQGRYPPSQAAFGTEFMKSNAQRYFEIYFRARYTIVALSVVGGLFVFLWARALWGSAGGLIAAALWTFSPNLLAHSGLVTTDLGAAVSGFVATYFFWRWLCCRSWKRAGWAGVGLGVAQLVKFSNLLLLGLWPLMALGWLLMERRKPVEQADGPRRAGWGVALKHGPLVLLACLLVINLGYGFEGTGRLLGSYEFLSQDLTVPRTSGAPPFHPDRILQSAYRERQNRFQGSLLGLVPVPLPEHYILGFDEQRFETDPGLEIGGYPVYLRGELRRTGWWYYYLYALAVKVPLGTWLLLGAAMILSLFQPFRRAVVGHEWVLALPPLAMLAAMSLLTDINLGLRYVLPVFPYLFVFIARLGKGLVVRHPPRIALMALVGIALGWNGAQAVAIWPHYLSYFNRLAGGPAQGYRHLIDSNLDWGQDLLELRRWLDRAGESGPIGLAYFGTVDPEIAGIDFFLPPRDRRGAPEGRRRLPSDRRKIQPGLYAVSATYLQGLPFRSRVAGRRVENHANAFRYFHALDPVDRAGYSIMIYRVSAEDAETLNRVLQASSEKIGTIQGEARPQKNGSSPESVGAW